MGDRDRPEEQRQTWRDWWPVGVDEPELITRAELLKRLADEGVTVAERELRHWGNKRALPPPIREAGVRVATDTVAECRGWQE